MQSFSDQIMRPTQAAHDDLDQALAQVQAAFITANAASQRQFETNAVYMPGANSRSVLFYAPFPLTIVRGEGAVLWDADGHRYDDFIAEYTAGVYGHSAPEIREAVLAAMCSGINLSGHNTFEGRLARLICERFPQIEQVRFTNSGTEANLMALTAALQFTGRRKIVVFSGGYHGSVLSFAVKPSAMAAPFDFLVLPYNDPEEARFRIAQHGSKIAAVLVEPMLGASGCIPAVPGFLQTLREATQQVGALLIVDEVMTSRLAPHGLAAPMGVTPDMTTLGKYIGGGMSFGAFGGRADIMAMFDPRCGPLAHSGTFNNNVVTMAAGYAGLTQLFPPEAAAALASRGEVLREKLNRLCAKAEVALQFTGIGSVMNSHFVQSQVLRPEDLAWVDVRLGRLFFFHLLSRGIYASPRGFIVLSLPVTDAAIDGLVAAVGDFVESWHGVLPRAESPT